MSPSTDNAPGTRSKGKRPQAANPHSDDSPTTSNSGPSTLAQTLEDVAGISARDRPRSTGTAPPPSDAGSNRSRRSHESRLQTRLSDLVAENEGFRAAILRLEEANSVINTNLAFHNDKLDRLLATLEHPSPVRPRDPPPHLRSASPADRRSARYPSTRPRSPTVEHGDDPEPPSDDNDDSEPEDELPYSTSDKPVKGARDPDPFTGKDPQDLNRSRLASRRA